LEQVRPAHGDVPYGRPGTALSLNSFSTSKPVIRFVDLFRPALEMLRDVMGVNIVNNATSENQHTCGEDPSHRVLLMSPETHLSSDQEPVEIAVSSEPGQRKMIRPSK
jgi:hypothetical protein